MSCWTRCLFAVLMLDLMRNNVCYSAAFAIQEKGHHSKKSIMVFNKSGEHSNFKVKYATAPPSNDVQFLPLQLMYLNNGSELALARKVELSTEFFIVPTASTGRYTSISPKGVILATKKSGRNSSIHSAPTIVPIYLPGFRQEPWVLPILILSSFSLIMMIIFEIFVLCKAWKTLPSNRHLFLGQMLLFGLFSCSAVAVLLTINPTVVSCAAIRFGTGLSFALVFASLLVKCVFLISLNSGIYLPATYQALLLLFAVLIQVAVSGQWLFNDPPALENILLLPESIPGGTRHRLLVTAEDLTNFSIPMCKTLFSHLLFSLVYVVLLMLIVAMLAIKTHGIKDNYRESTYIAIAIGAAIPITLGWILCAMVVPERHRDACLAFGLVATSGTVFIVMFMPKGRQLAAMGKEGLYSEDKIDQFSSLSHPHSGYSPSFYHFKPIDYGVIGRDLDDEKSSQIKRALATSFSSGLFFRPEEMKYDTTIERKPHKKPTLSTNPNVYFRPSSDIFPSMMY